VPATTRNWDTIQKVVQILTDTSAQVAGWPSHAPAKP